jgi:hypothetical protein
MVYTKFVDLDVIYNFLFDNFFIWDYLKQKKNVCFKLLDFEIHFFIFFQLLHK